MSKRILAAVAVMALAACSKGEKKDAALAADSLKRDLQLAPVDTTRPLADTAVAAPAAPAREPAAAPAPAPKPKPRPAPKPIARRASQPAPSTEAASTPEPAPAPASLAVGTVVRAAMVDSISSRHNKAGDHVTARVAEDVKTADGRVVIPAGSMVSLTIAEIHESENKSDKTGKLRLQADDISVNGKHYALAGSVEDVETHLVGRSTNAGDVAKVGAGAGIGAIVGRVIGGSTKGAVIGGLIGGAVGTQRAIETKDRDVAVAPGGNVTIKLRETFTAN